MAQPLRFLVLGRSHNLDLRLPGTVVRADAWPAALEALRREPFDAVVADLSDSSLLDTLRTLHQAQRILAAVPDGVAVVDFDLRVRWANPTFQSWCDSPAK